MPWGAHLRDGDDGNTRPRRRMGGCPLGHKALSICQRAVPRAHLNIKSLGAEASIIDLNYDDAVAWQNRRPTKTAGFSCRIRPLRAMRKSPPSSCRGSRPCAGISQQLQGVKQTPHLPAGGGRGHGGAVTGFFAEFYGDDLTIVTIVEPNRATAFLRRHWPDGALHPVTGDLTPSCGLPRGAMFARLASS
jgi:diaminopropionate ammonia-lyase